MRIERDNRKSSVVCNRSEKIMPPGLGRHFIRTIIDGLPANFIYQLVK
jgi:hypothetical protein